MANTPGHSRGLDLHGVGHLPLDTTTLWTTDFHGLPADLCTGLTGGHPVRGQGDPRLGHLYLCCIAPLLRGLEICGSSLGYPQPDLESGGDPHQGAGDYYTPSPRHETDLWRVQALETLP